MPHQDEKLNALHAAHAVHPHPDAVTDPLFADDQRFFDARDLVQVKYEMLRRVHVDGRAVSQTAATFGFSRPTFYAAQTAWQEGGLPGLLPERPGPRAAHKLTEPVLTFLDDLLTEGASGVGLITFWVWRPECDSCAQKCAPFFRATFVQACRADICAAEA